ncbi:hypothetical protein D3C84_981060 [compost metagenome]
MFHVLVVTHQYLLDAGAELAGDAGDLALHIGVVSTLVEASDQQPVAEQGQADSGEEDEEHGQAALQFCGHDRSSDGRRKCKQI